ncbi:MAG: hypothetical protein AAGK14_10830 [Verrucomicrobiota bacterium]
MIVDRPLGSVWYDANDAPLRSERWVYGEDGKIKETIFSNPNGEILFIETQDSDGMMVILDADRREIPYEQWEEAGVERFDPYNL